MDENKADQQLTVHDMTEINHGRYLQVVEIMEGQQGQGDPYAQQHKGKTAVPVFTDKIGKKGDQKQQVCYCNEM